MLKIGPDSWRVTAQVQVERTRFQTISASICYSSICMQVLAPTAELLTLHMDIKRDVYHRAEHPASRYNLFRVISCKDVEEQPLELSLLSRWYSYAKCAAACLASLVQDPIMVATEHEGTVIQDNEQFLPSSSQHLTAAGQFVNSSTQQDPARTTVSFLYNPQFGNSTFKFLDTSSYPSFEPDVRHLTCRVETTLLHLHRLLVIL